MVIKINKDKKTPKKIPKKKSVGRKFTTAEASRGGKANKRPRISDLLTEEQKHLILSTAVKKAGEGDTVMLKALMEQIYGRPVATVEGKIDANVTIEMITYG